MSSLIRIGAPPLLRLSGKKPELKSEEEMQPTSDSAPSLDLTTLQESLDALRGRAFETPNTFQAITRTLFQTGTRSQRTTFLRTHATTSEAPDRTTTQASQPVQVPTSPHLRGEGPAEESLRDSVVERWLLQQEDTGRKPVMSFVEAHKLYRDLFEEFVSTSILPPNLFADRFLQTPPNLTYEQAKTDLRVRLNSSPTTETARAEWKSQTEATT